MKVRDLPNVEGAVGQVLIADGLRSYSSIPSTPTYPLCVVAAVGGAGSYPAASPATSRVQVEVWGDKATSKADVLAYLKRAHRAVHEAEGVSVTVGDEAVFLTAVDDEIMPQWLPDPRTAYPRYLLSLRVTSHAVVLSS